MENIIGDIRPAARLADHLLRPGYQWLLLNHTRCHVGHRRLERGEAGERLQVTAVICHL